MCLTYPDFQDLGENTTHPAFVPFWWKRMASLMVGWTIKCFGIRHLQSAWKEGSGGRAARLKCVLILQMASPFSRFDFLTSVLSESKIACSGTLKPCHSTRDGFRFRGFTTPGFYPDPWWKDAEVRQRTDQTGGQSLTLQPSLWQELAWGLPSHFLSRTEKSAWSPRTRSSGDCKGKSLAWLPLKRNSHSLDNCLLILHSFWS